MKHRVSSNLEGSTYNISVKSWGVFKGRSRRDLEGVSEALIFVVGVKIWGKYSFSVTVGDRWASMFCVVPSLACDQMDN